MKIRNGFVSNSSSSSFICDVTGGVESGWDMSLDEANMYECEKGHTFYREYLIDPGKFKEKYLNEDSPDYDDEIAYGYGIPKENCPICSMNEFMKDDLFKYVLKVSGKSKEEFCNEVKSKFDSYDKFKEYIK